MRWLCGRCLGRKLKAELLGLSLQMTRGLVALLIFGNPFVDVGLAPPKHPID